MDLCIEAGYSEEIAQSNYLNMTAGVDEYSWRGGGSPIGFVSHTPQKIKAFLGIFTPFHLNCLSAFQWPFISFSLPLLSVCYALFKYSTSALGSWF